MRSALISIALSSLLATSAWAQQPQDDTDVDAESGADCCEALEELERGTGRQEPPPATAPTVSPEYTPSPTAPGYAAVRRPSPSSVPSLSTGADQADEPQIERRVMHGFRVGYGFIMNIDKDPDGDGEMKSLKEEFDIKSPHNFLLGYEVMYRLIGHDWLNVILIGNATIAGLEQSKFMPQATGLIGAEFNESFQLGVGVNVTPEPDRPAHMIMAAGWTPRAGGFHVPFHIFFIPDVDGLHRSGITTGVNW